MPVLGFLVLLVIGAVLAIKYDVFERRWWKAGMAILKWVIIGLTLFLVVWFAWVIASAN